MIYMSVEELSGYIKMSKSSIYKWTSLKEIPYYKKGNNLLFNKEEIDLWLQQYIVPTKDQLVNNVSKLLKHKSK